MARPENSFRPSSAESASGTGRDDLALPETAIGDPDARHVIVVADRFAQFARSGQVLTMQQLLTLLSSGAAAESGDRLVVHAGQGIDRGDVELLESLGVNGSSPVHVADRDHFVRQRVSPATVHKHRPENVLLAGLRTGSEGHCAAELRVHRENELILDHHTGEHVQGIVIIEAMRQICIAQFETGYRPALPPGDYVGVWKRLNLSFEGFLFPLHATVRAEIVEADLARENTVNFRASTSLRQNGDLVASADIEYAMIKQDRIGTLERRKSDQATTAQLAVFAE